MRDGRSTIGRRLRIVRRHARKGVGKIEGEFYSMGGRAMFVNSLDRQSLSSFIWIVSPFFSYFFSNAYLMHDLLQPLFLCLSLHLSSDSLACSFVTTYLGKHFVTVTSRFCSVLSSVTESASPLPLGTARMPCHSSLSSRFSCGDAALALFRPRAVLLVRVKFPS